MQEYAFTTSIGDLCVLHVSNQIGHCIVNFRRPTIFIVCVDNSCLLISENVFQTTETNCLRHLLVTVHFLLSYLFFLLTCVMPVLEIKQFASLKPPPQITRHRFGTAAHFSRKEQDFHLIQCMYFCAKTPQNVHPPYLQHSLSLRMNKCFLCLRTSHHSVYY